MEPGGAGRSRASIANRWTVAAAAVIMQSGFGSLYAWSVFRQPLSAHYGTDITTVNLTFFIAGLVFAISTFGAGFLLRRVGPRAVGIVGGLLFGLGVFLSAFRRREPPAPLRYVRPRAETSNNPGAGVNRRLVYRGGNGIMRTR